MCRTPFTKILIVGLLPWILIACKHDADKFPIKGIDVSHYQKQIDWKSVAADEELQFVFIKATESHDYVDSLFHRNWQALEDSRLLRGAYHFFRPRIDPQAQANLFKKQVKLRSGDLLPVLDIEELDGVAPKTLVFRVGLWLTSIEAHYGARPIIYSSMDFYKRYLQKDFAAYPLWIARYNRKKPPGNWQFWQYSNQGHQKGIQGEVDLNVFQGTKEELKQLRIH